MAVIDVETTGANPVGDRITEIAVLRIEQGHLVDSWSSLVNPGIPIPEAIQRFTGITDAMVGTAPDFAGLSDRLRGLLEGRVFVAHNARFDFGFIKNEFRRIGQDFDAQVLCTVRLSRALYPEHHRHGLDALIARHGLHCAARHRALGDAQALWSFLRQAEETFPPATLADAADRAMKRPSRPPGLPEGVLEGLPPWPGVYLFYGEERAAGGEPLYVGKGADLRSRVTAHFAAGHRKGREAEMARRVRHVETFATAGELGAQLLEAQLIRTLRPPYNRAPHASEEVRGLRLLPHRRKPPVLERVRLAGRDPADWADTTFGAFRGKREIDNTLRELALLHRLCPVRLGIEASTGGPCTALRTKRCAGVCAGREDPAEHDARLAAALARLRLKPWPWPGAVALREYHAEQGRSTLHVVDRWCHLGSAEDEPSLAELLDGQPPRQFDLDVYRILERWLSIAAHRDDARSVGGR